VDLRRQVHRNQDLLGDVLGLDEGDEAELGLALGANSLKPEGSAEQLCPRDMSGLGGLLVFSGRQRE
jgi:hypothetical protein